MRKGKKRAIGKSKVVTCPRCGYAWLYRGKLMWAMCPNCRRWVRVW
jgi:Zn-finger nucleic acid-binding protein